MPFAISGGVGLNQFVLGQNLKGDYRAYFYAHSNYYDSGYDYKSWPVVFNNTAADEPGVLLSGNETELNMRVSDINPEGWKTATFAMPDQINSGTKVWFGLMSRYSRIRFDYGQPCVKYELEPCVDYEMARYWDEDCEEWIEAEVEVDTPFHDWLRREENTPLDRKAYKLSGFIENSSGWNLAPGARIDFKLSMYLAIPAAYTRTAAQGAGLTDARKTAAAYQKTLAQKAVPGESRKQAGNYRRSAAQTAGGAAVTKRFEGFCRNLVQTVRTTVTAKGPLALPRKLTQQAGAGAVSGRLLSMLRKPAQTAGTGDGTQRVARAKRSVADAGKLTAMTGWKQDFERAIAHWGSAAAGVMRKAGYAKRLPETAANRDGAGAARNLALRLAEAAAALYGMKAAGGFDRWIADQSGAGSVMGGMVLFFRVLFGVGGGGDSAERFVGRLRGVQDTETAGDAAGLAAEYLRGLFLEAGAAAEGKHTAWHKRGVVEYADITAVPFRHLFVFIRLVAGAHIRDFIIGRFLKSREELVIKSPVRREIVLESRLH